MVITEISYCVDLSIIAACVAQTTFCPKCLIFKIQFLDSKVLLGKFIITLLHLFLFYWSHFVIKLALKHQGKL